MIDAPERIGLLTDGLGYYALATAEESNTSTHYVRADLYDAQSDRIAELEAATQWQPIDENTPKREVIIVFGRGESILAQYDPNDFGHGDDWWCPDPYNKGRYTLAYYIKPTHWMPLPTPPEKETV